jgi:hypothetical protein
MSNRTGLQPNTNAVLGLVIVFLILAMGFAAPSALAKSRKVKSDAMLTERESEPGQSLDLSQRQRSVTLSFKQLGAWSSLRLKGVDGFQTLFFPIRPDEVVVSAKLRIAYDYSPALIPELSHLKILLNDRIAAVEALPKDKSVGNTRDINLDPRLFRESNSLQFKLIGHYTRQCEDPYHSSLWLTLSDLGRLELTVARISVANDLKNLPLPFFDRKESTPLRVPFVFAKTPSFGTLQSAGIVASWFGMQSKSQGMQFPVSINQLPEGNAVVFLQNGENVEGIKGVANASVSLVAHPTNPMAKLLLVSGSNDAEISRAAHAIALTAHSLAGQMVTITKELDAAVRKPYDAPAWIPTDRPVRFGELLRPEEMRVHAYYPDTIRMNFRAPPDLFVWHSAGVPTNLKFRATHLPSHQNSSLNVGLNSNLVRTFALNQSYAKAPDAETTSTTKLDGTGIRSESIHMPAYALNGRDQLQFSYYFDVIKQGECQSLPPNNLEGTIDPESTIDFSNFPHYAALPNLAYFSTLGFPFTKMADLSETAVLLPDNPNADELGLYLMLMGRMGESTGYPALRHSVVSHINVEKVSTRDLLVISSATNQSLMIKWKERLPMVQIDGDRRIRESHSSWRPTYRWAQEDLQSKPIPAGNLQLAGNASLATIMAFESPLQAKRSVVFFYADKSGDLRKITDALSDPDLIPTIQGDFVVVDDKGVNHTKVSDTYYIGTLPVLSKIRWFLSDQPLVLALLALLACLIIGTVVYKPLQRIVHQRKPLQV